MCCRIDWICHMKRRIHNLTYFPGYIKPCIWEQIFCCTMTLQHDRRKSLVSAHIVCVRGWYAVGKQELTASSSIRHSFRHISPRTKSPHSKLRANYNNINYHDHSTLCVKPNGNLETWWVHRDKITNHYLLRFALFIQNQTCNTIYIRHGSSSTEYMYSEQLTTVTVQ